jgi:hypothetical protein
MCAAFVIFKKKQPKENNNPKGENLSNPVALAVMLSLTFHQRENKSNGQTLIEKFLSEKNFNRRTQLSIQKVRLFGRML